MSCFGGVARTYSSSSSGTVRGGGGRSRPWRWWRAKCAAITATVGSRLRRSIDGRRRRATSSVMHRRRRQYSTSFAPVYIDELYTHHHDQQPISKQQPLKLDAVAVQEEPTTSGSNHVAGRAGAKATARVAAATTTTTTATPAPGARARASQFGARGGKPRAAADAGVGAMKSILMRSPGRGGGGVLGVVRGMGEVDLRAELFIRRFKEDMRLQSQRSAEEFQAMLARGL